MDMNLSCFLAFRLQSPNTNAKQGISLRPSSYAFVNGAASAHVAYFAGVVFTVVFIIVVVVVVVVVVNNNRYHNDHGRGLADLPIIYSFVFVRSLLSSLCTPPHFQPNSHIPPHRQTVYKKSLRPENSPSQHQIFLCKRQRKFKRVCLSPSSQEPRSHHYCTDPSGRDHGCRIARRQHTAASLLPALVVASAKWR